MIPKAFGVSPAPDGGYANFNTAEGQNALFSLTTGIYNTALGGQTLHNVRTGGYNTGVGLNALYFNTASFNTATGVNALYANTGGNRNTANGVFALRSNQIGMSNTAIGTYALYKNTADNNTAIGDSALQNNITGHDNTALGFLALFSSQGGAQNTAIGDSALYGNDASGTGLGSGNTAIGFNALQHNNDGGGNTANGFAALFNNISGDNNVALGRYAGENLDTGDNNIDIGYNVTGVAGESNTIRIGNTDISDTYIRGISGTTSAGGMAVYVNSNGHLGTTTSSVRFKDEIKPVGNASQAILALRPVSFRYKKEIDPNGIPEFGLIAEEVEKVNPDLVIRDQAGKPYTVRYEQINAMLLNEFLKEHSKVERQAHEIQEQKGTVDQLRSAMTKQDEIIARQQEGMELLAAHLKEQAAQLQKVSARLEAARLVRQVVVKNP